MPLCPTPSYPVCSDTPTGTRAPDQAAQRPRQLTKGFSEPKKLSRHLPDRRLICRFQVCLVQVCSYFSCLVTNKLRDLGYLCQQHAPPLPAPTRTRLVTYRLA